MRLFIARHHALGQLDDSLAAPPTSCFTMGARSMDPFRLQGQKYGQIYIMHEEPMPNRFRRCCPICDTPPEARPADPLPRIVKIGLTSEPVEVRRSPEEIRRKSELQTGNPRELTVGWVSDLYDFKIAIKADKAVKSWLGKEGRHVKREWFAVTPHYARLCIEQFLLRISSNLPIVTGPTPGGIDAAYLAHRNR